MLVASGYRTKAELKASVGQPFEYEETSFFGPEYRDNGRLTVVGPSPRERKWFANVTMKDGKIEKVE